MNPLPLLLPRVRVAAGLTLALAALPLAPSATAQTDLVITGVIDGPLSGGTPKAIELYALDDIADLGTYGIGSANNGGGSDGAEFPLSGSAAAGDFLYVASEAVNFDAFFGFQPSYVSGAASINGDDAIELFYDASGAFAGSEVVVDVFGDIDTDGSGEAWEYLDGWAYRADGTGPDGPTFEVGNFAYSGPNALDGETSNGTASTPFPIASYTPDDTETPGDGAIVVTTNEDGEGINGVCSLREAVEAANTNTRVDACSAGQPGEDTIRFDPSLVENTIVLSEGDLDVTEDLVVDGTDGIDVTPLRAGSSAPLFITISGNDASRVFDVQMGTLTLLSLSLTDGLADNGGLVYVAAGAAFSADDLTATDGVATGDAATDGGGALYLAGGSATVTNSTFTTNRATGTAGSGGAVNNQGGTFTATSTRFDSNSAMRAGGGIEDALGTTTLTDVTLFGNNGGTAPGNGGGLHTGGGTVTLAGGLVTANTAVEGGGLWSSGSLTVDGTTIQNNEAVGDADAAFEGGGGLFNQGGTMAVSNAEVTGNSATGPGGSGGGAFNNGGDLSIDASSFSGNTSLRAGGGIEVNGGSVTLEDTDFTGNGTGDTPGNGGALHVTTGTVTAAGGEVTGNTAAREGGGFWNNAGWTMTVDGTLFSGNTASGDAADDGGGALFNNGGTLTVTDASLVGNVADGASGSGGGILNLGGELTVNGGTIQSNAANRAGGGIEDAGGSVVLNGVLVSENTIAVAAPGNGGGLHSGGGTVTVRDGTFANNTAVEGGGLWTDGTLVMESSRPGGSGGPGVVDNVATGDDADQGGGGLYAESGADVTLMDAIIGNNRASGTSGSGGGVFVADGATVRIARGVVLDNRASRAGAGIEIADDPTTSDVAGFAEIVDVDVTQNAIVNANPGNGGGLHIGGAARAFVQRSTFSNNAAAEGGGLWVSGGGTLGMNNSTVSGNNVTGDGGGVYLVGGGTVGLDALTVADNTAGGSGGGLGRGDAPGGFFGFTNTIVADNAAAAGPDCFGSYEASFSLVEDTAGCTLTGEDNLTGQDPMLEGLDDNGGFTLTHALPATSPAVDAGDTQFAVDQRGFARAVGQDDIGAYEFGATDDGGGTLACSMDVPLAFGDFDTDGNDADFGEFAEVVNGAGSEVDLSSCSFATFDPQTETVIYTAQTTGIAAASGSYVLATLSGDQAIPPGSIPDGPGAIVLLEGAAQVGATVADVLDDVVAAVVYRTEDDVFASMSGGGTAAQREQQRAAFLAALARLSQPVADEGGVGAVDLAVEVAPNPMRARSTVSFGVAEAADVRVSVYDALGREVAVLADAPFGAGRHDVAFDARDLPAGVYVVRATVGADSRTTRLTIAR